jgi:hypothetical protein
MNSLQAALKQPLEAQEWQKIADFAQNSWHVTPTTTLTSPQVLTLLNKVFALRVARAQATLLISPVEPTPVSQAVYSKKAWAIAIAILVAIILLWLVL